MRIAYAFDVAATFKEGSLALILILNVFCTLFTGVAHGILMHAIFRALS